MTVLLDTFKGECSIRVFDILLIEQPSNFLAWHVLKSLNGCDQDETVFVHDSGSLFVHQE